MMGSTWLGFVEIRVITFAAAPSPAAPRRSAPPLRLVITAQHPVVARSRGSISRRTLAPRHRSRARCIVPRIGALVDRSASAARCPNQRGALDRSPPWTPRWAHRTSERIGGFLSDVPPPATRSR